MCVVNDLSKDVTLFNKSEVGFKRCQPLLDLLKSLSIPFHFDFELFLLALQGLLSLKKLDFEEITDQFESLEKCYIEYDLLTEQIIFIIM